MRVPRNDRVRSDTPDGVPERKCILSGRHGARDALIRLAVSPPDESGHCTVLPDVMARAPGRGAWIGVSRVELEKALAKGKLRSALMHAFGKWLDGQPLTIPEDLPDRIDRALLRVVTDRLGLELRAGRVVLGSDRISGQARAGRIAWLGHAADASDDGSRKLDQALRVGRDAEGTGLSGTILPLDREALSVALGRDNVVHLALNDKGAAQRVAAPLERLRQFRGNDAPGTPTGADQAAMIAAETPEIAGTTVERLAVSAGTVGARTLGAGQSALGAIEVMRTEQAGRPDRNLIDAPPSGDATSAASAATTDSVKGTT